MPDPALRNDQRTGTPWWAALAFGVAAALAAKKPLPRTGVPVPARRDRARDSLQEGSKPRDGKGDARGHAADKPSDLTAASWKDILWRVYEEIGNDRVLAVAAGVTFYSLLAVFPAIVALVSLYGLFADTSTISAHLSAISGIMPSGALDVIGEQVKRIASKPHGSLGFGFIAGLAVALWSANAGMKAMFDALNIVYDEKEKRSFIVLNAVSLVFTIAALVVLMLALGAVVVMPVVLKFLPLGSLVEIGISLLRWPILLVLIITGLAVLYRYGPSRERPRWRWVTWGSGFAAVAWLVGSMLFSWYVSSFGSYNETYGSLGAAIGFMTWIWISTTIILIGAEINAEMEHETARDTTKGGGKPLGARGASMADRVAGA